MYIFVNKGANEIVRLYNNIVGKPVLPPFWALGWQQAAWPYKTLQDMKTVVEKYAEHELPLDVMWADIEYMKEYRNFEIKEGEDWAGLLPWID